MQRRTVRRRIVLPLLALACTGGLLWWYDHATQGHADCAAYVRQVGRVVDRATGAPLSGARVMLFRYEAEARDAERVAIQLALDELYGPDWTVYGHDWTDADGRFACVTEVTWSFNAGAISAFWRNPGLRQRRATRTLRIETGRGPVHIVTPPPRSWVQHGGDCAATVDYGTVEVP